MFLKSLRKAPRCRFGISFLLLLGLAKAEAPNLSEAFFNDSGTVILFLGDSITNNGGFIDQLKTRLLQKFPGMKAKIINAGVSGESLTKLLVRLDAQLQQHKPDLVFSMYGMNDGGYDPLSESGFKTYKDNNLKLVAAVEKTGAPLILMTPTPFDSLTGAPMIVDKPPYAFKTFYRNYDSVLTAFGDWLQGLRGPDRMVIDMQTPLKTWAKAQRVKDARFAWTKEGVHPTDAAHVVMGDGIFAALFTPTTAVHRPARAGAMPRGVFSAGEASYSANGARLSPGAAAIPFHRR